MKSPGFSKITALCLYGIGVDPLIIRVWGIVVALNMFGSLLGCLPVFSRTRRDCLPIFRSKKMPCKVCGGFGHNKATCPQLNPGAKRTPSYSVGSYYHRRQNFTVRVAQPSSTLAMATAMQASTLTTSKLPLPLPNATFNIGITLPESSSVVTTPKDDKEDAMRRDEDRKAQHLQELENAQRIEQESRMLQEKHKLEEQERGKQEAILEVQRKESARVRAKRSRSQEWAESYLSNEAERCAVYYLDWNDTIRPLKINQHTAKYCVHDSAPIKKMKAVTNVDSEWDRIRSEVDRIQHRRDRIKEKIRFLMKELNRANIQGRRLLVCSIPARIEQYQNEAKIVENEMCVWGGRQLSYLKQCWMQQKEEC